MKAGYANYPGYGNTPHGGIRGFEEIFSEGIDLASEKDLLGIDALILWGGSDISAELYGQKHYMSNYRAEPSERDLFEWELMKLAVRAKKPIIGICRGAQMLCAFAGGKLVQHVNGHQSGAHDVVTSEGEIFTKVSSLHHQMMYPFNLKKNEFQVLATTTRNLSNVYEGLTFDEKQTFKVLCEPEVVYFPRLKGMAIQCHPELHTGFNSFNKWVVAQTQELCFGVKAPVINNVC
jgi:gamma-glutamyl-gamma-aminobutyrate hydrolase PuuD